MLIAEREFISAPLLRAVGTTSDADSSASLLHECGGAAAWQRVIDFTLLPWLRDPAQLADDGLVPPAGSTVRLALDIAERFRDDRIIAPNRVVPDPNGGIVFERQEGAVVEAVHIWEDGLVEYMRFEGALLVERRPF